MSAARKVKQIGEGLSSPGEPGLMHRAWPAGAGVFPLGGLHH